PYAGPTAPAGADRDYAPGEKIRLLYAGRLERRKGVHNLVRALTGLARDDFRVTVVGGDTPTAPLGVSMRDLISLEVAQDGRFQLLEAVDRDALAELIRGHDVVLIPSLWECWPYAALEAMSLNRPLLATPVGGLIEMVRPERSGWLAGGTDSEALESALEAILDDRDALCRLAHSEGPRQQVQALSAEAEILAGYERLGGQPGRRSGRSATGKHSPAPLVSAIVPYWHSARYVRETLDSLLAQTYPRLEIILVNDGSFAEEDWIVAELAARMPMTVVSQMNRGLGSARNFGISNAQGRYVFPLDADNTVSSDFVARCVSILEARPEVAYVTSWSRYVDEQGQALGDGEQGYEPLGNFAGLNEDQNVAGDAAAVLPRRLFDIGFKYSEELTSYEDWHLYRELARDRRYGCVIPERLLRYRVHPQSMQARIAVPRQARLRREMAALLRESEMRWTSSSA
ncbi:MAG TPA: glycosyltransferase, partial [Myxococcaceae bacterium]|nr:glycosyltransferase [Myxococcaceae bacterium]